MNLPNAIERLRNVVRRQHKSLSTEDSYVYWLRRYVSALNSMPSSLPRECGVWSAACPIAGRAMVGAPIPVIGVQMHFRCRRDM